MKPEELTLPPYSQLPATARTIYESWTIVFQRPTKYTRCWAQVLGCTVGKTMATEPGRIVVVRPNTHFAQDNLANVLICAREQHQPRSLVKKPRAYEEDLEYRLRRLDWTVQDELYALLRDRSESASSPFRRREYKLAVLLEVVGGEMTDAAGGGELVGTRNRWWWLGGRRRRRRRSHKTTAPHVEYRLVLRGSEVKANDAGWGGYHRYSQPWREADRAGLHCETEKAVYQGLLG